ncbi:hypothetical protein [Streptomyces sp. NPDC056291]
MHLMPVEAADVLESLDCMVLDDHDALRKAKRMLERAFDEYEESLCSE